VLNLGTRLGKVRGYMKEGEGKTSVARPLGGVKTSPNQRSRTKKASRALGASARAGEGGQNGGTSLCVTLMTGSRGKVCVPSIGRGRTLVRGFAIGGGGHPYRRGGGSGTAFFTEYGAKGCEKRKAAHKKTQKGEGGKITNEEKRPIEKWGGEMGGKKKEGQAKEEKGRSAAAKAGALDKIGWT